MGGHSPSPKTSPKPAKGNKTMQYRISGNHISNFEVATIHDGANVGVALRRRGPAIMDRLTHSARVAVDTYVSTSEAVLAGGATVSGNMLTGGCGGGGKPSDGRQSNVVDQVRFLRAMEVAVGDAVLVVGRRDPAHISAIDLWRRVCLGDITMTQYLRRQGLAPAKSRMKALNDGFIDAANRVADAIGKTKSPFL